MATLRDTLTQSIKQDPKAFYKKVKAQNIGLSQSEWSSLEAGSLKAFTDQRLEDRFNTKVLGALGINYKQSSQTQGRHYESTSKTGSSEQWNKGSKSYKSDKKDDSSNW